jgi:hypothetical protein
MNHPKESEHYEIIIDDPALTKHGFRKFLLPLNGNGNGTVAGARMVVHNTDKSKMMYPTFYKSDLDKTVQSLRDKIISDGILIDKDTADGLVAYFRNEGVLLSEDEHSEFFKNGNRRIKKKIENKRQQQQETAAIIATAEAVLAEDDDEEDEQQQVKEEEVIIDPSKDLDPYISDKDGDYAEYAIRSIKKTVKQEDSLVRQLFYTALSKDAASPQNLAVLASTSEGKTHPVLETLQYFPEEHVWMIGSMSPKVIIRQNGILVDRNNEPLEPTIKEYKKQIRDLKNEIDRNNKTTKKVTDLEDKIELLQDKLNELYQEAKVLIDLRGKLFVFLEPPHPETWNILKPILSHDRYEIEHPYVYQVEGKGFKVKNIVNTSVKNNTFYQQQIIHSASQNGKTVSQPQEIHENSIENSISEPSPKNLEESSTTIEHVLYWIESIGLWGCKYCNLRLDKFGMENTSCKGNKKAKL